MPSYTERLERVKKIKDELREAEKALIIKIDQVRVRISEHGVYLFAENEELKLTPSVLETLKAIGHELFPDIPQPSSISELLANITPGMTLTVSAGEATLYLNKNRQAYVVGRGPDAQSALFALAARYKELKDQSLVGEK